MKNTAQNKSIPEIYASKSITKYIMDLVNIRYVKSGLTIDCIAGGMIVIAEKVQCFGVFAPNGIFVEQSLQTRGKGQLIPDNVVLENIPYFDYDAVYLGNVDDAFGHYILEHWTRSYAFLNEKYKTMKFVIVNDMRFNPVPNFVTKLAYLLGIPSENFIILDKTSKFRNVYVPESAFKLVRYSSIEFGEIYAKIAENVKKEYDFEKIYVSRAGLKQRKVYGEEKVQSIFKKNGYHIVYPEQLPLEEQIALMKNCKSLAGCAGTALHLALFMYEGGNVYQIRRNKIKDGNCGTQYLITEAKKLHLTYIDASIEKYKTRHGENKAQIIGVNDNMKRFFDDNGFKYSPNDLEFDKEAWEEYLLQAKKLEALRLERYGGKSEFQVNLLHKIVKFLACFIYNRHKRVAFRTKLRKRWGIL
ncbi:MAG: glycosyltransferase family 61 protein [Paludibacter sp.]|nr:glycosyltransferase family 61 protein [Paludibacter sp.]